MQDALVLKITFPSGVEKEFQPVLHPDVGVDVQAMELRAYIYRRLAAGRHLSVEVHLETGETAQQIIPIDQVAAAAVLLRRTSPRDSSAFKVEPRHVRTGAQAKRGDT